MAVFYSFLHGGWNSVVHIIEIYSLKLFLLSDIIFCIEIFFGSQNIIDTFLKVSLQ